MHRSVLLSENDPTIAKLARMILDKGNIPAHVVSGVRGTMQFIEENSYDVLILDDSYHKKWFSMIRDAFIKKNPGGKVCIFTVNHEEIAGQFFNGLYDHYLYKGNIFDTLVDFVTIVAPSKGK